MPNHPRVGYHSPVAVLDVADGGGHVGVPQPVYNTVYEAVVASDRSPIGSPSITVGIGPTRQRAYRGRVPEKQAMIGS
jgi:hypothetical protein